MGQVRAIAAAAGISQATKKSSVGICFVGKRPFAEFVAQYIEMAPGRFRDVEGGEDKGPHKGIAVRVCACVGACRWVGG